MKTASYEFQPYDVLQSLRGGTWEDFSTLRTEEEARLAVFYVDSNGGGVFNGQDGFRITRSTVRDMRDPVYEK